MSFDYTKRARKWYERALTEKDDFVRFILFYIALEVSIKRHSKGIRALKNDDAIRDAFMREIPECKIQELKISLDKKPLRNENPNGDKRWSGKLDHSQDFQGIIEFVIRARNNLFHGEKGLDEERDMFIVTWGSILLGPLLKVILK